MQSMKKLKYLEILWVSKNDVKLLLLIIGYPVYGGTIEELTIRVKVKDSTNNEALVFLLTEWTAIMLAPSTLNVVCRKCGIVSILQEWWMSFKNSVSQPAYHTRHLNFYAGFNVIIGLAPLFPLLHVEISFVPSYCISCVIAENCGLSGLEKDLLLSKRSIGNGRVLHKGILKNHRYSNYGTPMSIKNIEFLTHLSAANCGFFSMHLEQLAVACPNLQQLSLLRNVNCLKSLQGLRAIANCQKLEGLNIREISVKDLESHVQLWEVIVDLQLTYLSIDLCCLLCSEGGNQTKIISLHQKCLKLKALESYYSCTKCDETKLPLVLSNFPSLIHCITDIENIIICDRLKYLHYWHNKHSWEIANCNLEQVYILSVPLVLSDSFMVALSAHGGLVHVILSIKFVTHSGIAALIGNSPNLITYHIYSAESCMSRDFRLWLKTKYICSQKIIFVWHSLFCKR